MQHHLRAEEAGERAARRFAAARLPDLIFALHQDGQQLLFDVAAAVPALVNDQRLLVAVLANLFLELAQRRLTHRLDVQVADAPVRHFLNHLAPLPYPALVMELAERLHRHRLDARPPRAVFIRLVVERHRHLAVQAVVQQLPVIVARLHRLAVNGDQVIAALDLHPVFIRRAVFVNRCHFITTRRGVRLKGRQADLLVLPRFAAAQRLGQFR